MAFNLNAIGAGLGLFAEDYRKQQEANLRQQQFRQQLLEQQRQQTAAQGIETYLRNLGAGQGAQYQPIQPGGGVGSGLDMGTGLAGGDQNQPLYRGGAAPMGGYSGGAGRGLSALSPSRDEQAAFGNYRAAGGTKTIEEWLGDSRGGAGGGGMGGNTFRDALRQQFGQLGLPPTYADAAAAYMQRNESGNNPLAVNPTSGALGRAQWLGPRKQQLLSKYGPQPSDEQQASFIGEELRGPENKTLAALRTAAESGAPPKAAYDTWGKAYERPGPAALAKAGVDNPMVKAQYEVQQGAQNVAQNIDPMAQGRAALAYLYEQIDRAMPGADPMAKMMALDKLQGYMAPYEKQKWELFKQRHEDEIWHAHADYNEKLTRGREDRSEARELSREKRAEERGGQVFQDPTTGEAYRVPPSGKAQPVEGLPTGAMPASGAASRIGKPTSIEVTEEDGSVKRIEAQQLPSGQWVTADERRQPVDTSRGYTVVPASAAGALGGSRDAAQRERQLISGREIVSDLQNVVELPISTTRGIFGGRQQGPGLLDALKENLAETMTSEEAELANSALAGLERELSIIVSPVYGGKWAAESFKSLALKEGQSYLVKLYNLARMRQTADNALEAMQTSPRIGRDQKAYAAQMQKWLADAVPWTTNDVIGYRKSKESGQTFRQFAEQQHIGAGSGGGAAGPKEGDIATSPGKPDLIFRGGKWVPVEPPT